MSHLDGGEHHFRLCILNASTLIHFISTLFVDVFSSFNNTQRNKTK